jgi:PHP family Zn ribbon phosphoesterase
MNLYKADLHIHTVLSPCGDLEMSPKNIVKEASEKGLNIIGITDHNTTHHCKLVKQLAEPLGITLLMGAEITTKEEIHCLAYFETDDQLDDMQEYLDFHLPNIPNDPAIFGYQVVVDENEEILWQEERLLITAINQSIEQVERKVHSLGGIFIPAHIDKNRYSLISQLGFIPKNLNPDAFEISRHSSHEELLPYLKGFEDITIVRNSDAHSLADIGGLFTMFAMEQPGFEGFRAALGSSNTVTPIIK